MDKIVVYTANFGWYDKPREPVYHEGVRYIYFTDTKHESNVWEVVLSDITAKPIRAARKRKILSHKFVGDASYTIWLDANIRLLADPITLCETYLEHSDMALFGHPYRDCVYDEADVCISLGKGDLSIIESQVEHYESVGIPHHVGIMETGFILRRHTPQIAEFNEVWWDEVDEWSTRDQISFPVACHKTGMEYEVIPGNVRRWDAVDYAWH